MIFEVLCMQVKVSLGDTDVLSIEGGPGAAKG